jgi:drug/metabolite transporter (DMT)-like permease
VAGVGEVVGTAIYTVGAQDSIAIAAVLASQFAAMAAVGGFIVFGERLTRLQGVGVVAVLVGVAIVTLVQV